MVHYVKHILTFNYSFKVHHPIKSSLKCSPVLMAPSAYVLHCSEAAGDTSKAIKVVQDGATCLQVIRVSCGLGWDEGTAV